VIELAEVFLAKAEESLAGAESEFANRRYNNCANRCYYACFQAAVHALIRAGVSPRGDQRQWRHAFVQAGFVGQLVNRRKLYPPDLRDALERTYGLRQRGDYTRDFVTELEASRAFRRTGSFLEAVRTRSRAP
jgi:uncharacterized protein (UPF0332 family)